MHLGQDHCDCEALRSELDGYRQHELRELSRHERERRNREQEREQSLREPDGWDDAFRSQAVLLRREIAVDCGDDPVYFKDTLEVNERARQLWVEKQAEIKALRKRHKEEMAELRKRLLAEVADRIENEFIGREAAAEMVGNFLRGDDPQGYVNW